MEFCGFYLAKKLQEVLKTSIRKSNKIYTLEINCHISHGQWVNVYKEHNWENNL